MGCSPASPTTPMRRRGYRFLLDAEDLRRGTFAPFSLASLSPIAIACFRLFTVRPELLFRVPFLRRRIADVTLFEADRPYFAICLFLLASIVGTGAWFVADLHAVTPRVLAKWISEQRWPVGLRILNVVHVPPIGGFSPAASRMRFAIS
jgi:hypothetical protein